MPRESHLLFNKRKCYTYKTDIRYIKQDRELEVCHCAYNMFFMYKCKVITVASLVRAMDHRVFLIC